MTAIDEPISVIRMPPAVKVDVALGKGVIISLSAMATPDGPITTVSSLMVLVAKDAPGP